MRILVVEDYTPLRRTLQRGLREAGFSVDIAADGEEGLFLAGANPYDAIVLDLMLPKIDGLTVLKRLRESGRQVPVLVLTARDGVDDRIQGLDLGADDYLPKPFAFNELLARVRALVRRAYHTGDPVMRIGHLAIDTASRRVRVDDEEVTLTAREYALLELLARRHGELVTRGEVFEHCYGFDADTASNVIDVYIGYLRKKIERSGRPKLIHTRRGQGYQLSVEA
jgi:two-component system OmpR family response regulator